MGAREFIRGPGALRIASCVVGLSSVFVALVAGFVRADFQTRTNTSSIIEIQSTLGRLTERAETNCRAITANRAEQDAINRALLTRLDQISQDIKDQRAELRQDIADLRRVMGGGK